MAEAAAGCVFEDIRYEDIQVEAVSGARSGERRGEPGPAAACPVCVCG